jgi:hypothetical protein
MRAIATFVYRDRKPVAPLLAAATEVDSDSNACCCCSIGPFASREELHETREENVSTPRVLLPWKR